MPDAVIVDVVRTPIGRAFKGSLAGERAEDLGAFAIKTLVEKYQDAVAPEDYDEVIIGCRLPRQRAGLQRRPQRMAAGRLPRVRPGPHRLALLRLVSCRSIRAAANAIRPATATIYLAGGLEASSRAGAQPRLHDAPQARRL